MNLTMIISAISAAVAGVAGFGLAWQLQAGNITQLELDHAEQRIATARASRVTLERVTGQIATAQAGSAKRNVRVRTDADRAGNSGNGLRLASTATVRASEDFTDACRSIIAAYDTVVATGSEFILEVARDADQCHSDLQLIQEAWDK